MLKVSVIGFGSRGQGFASRLCQMKDVKLIAVADVAQVNRELAKKYGVEEKFIFNSADNFFEQGKICDAIFLCTQDAQHHEMAIKALNLGYDICLEKPAASTLEDCIDIRDTANRLNRKVMLTHVLRYAPFYQYIKKVIDENTLGQVVNIRQTENIAYWHFALSYVRGPWRNIKDSTPTIIAKCCHDLDIIKWLVGKKCKSVSSYGNLYYFNSQHAPQGSADYCVDCAKEVRDKCLFNAYNIYPKRMQKQVVGGTARLKSQNIFDILDKKQDVIGRCVFRGENDAIDNQVVNMLFENGTTANLTMTAFSDDCHRTIEVHGTKGEIYGDIEESKLYLNIYGDKTQYIIDVNKLSNDDNVELADGHGGGDYYLTKDFIDYITKKSQSITRTTIDDSIESHLMGFKAEESRLNGGKSIDI